MDEALSVNTGIRITKAQQVKLDRLADCLKTSRNRVFGMLIDAAEIKTVPAAVVELKNNGHDAKELSRHSITTVGA